MQRPRNAARLAVAIACAAAVLATATATPAHADKNDAPAIRSLQKTLLGKVSRLNEDNRIKPVHPREFADVEYLAVYYSAHWCPPCRDFTPKLASFYNDFKPDHPNFELVFLSND
ncbi:MAG: thioredoxin-like domain-containing protein, partial [Planctomycetota bacterium]